MAVSGTVAAPARGVTKQYSNPESSNQRRAVRANEEAEASPDRAAYSVRSAAVGSIRLARRAGIQHATAATSPSVMTAAASVSGSVGGRP